MRIYNLDEDYFEIIDTQEKSYWLGFLAADGNISFGSKETKSLRLNFSLIAKDIDMIQKFKAATQATYPIKTFKGAGYSHTTEIAKIQLNSNKLCNDLMKQGIVMNKTEHGVGKPTMSQEMFRHYLRGFFDGDGYVGFVPRKECPDNRKRDRFNFEIVSNTKSILEYFHECLQKEDIVVSIYQRKSNGVYRLITGSRTEGRKLFHFMYDDSSTFIKRKYDVFCNIAV